MKLRKKMVAMVATAVAVCMVGLTGCQAKLEPADQVVSALYELSAKDNAAPLKDLLGFASEDDVRKSLVESGEAVDFVGEITSIFTEVGIEFDEAELADMTDQLTGLLNKVTCTAAITEESSKETTVVLTVTGYSMDEIESMALELQTKAMEEMSEETMAAIQSGDEAAAMDFMKQFMKDYVSAIAAMDPNVKTEITVKCEKLKLDVSGKDKVAWLPTDMAKFESDVENSMMK